MSKALVVLSGGADSTICLYWAKKKFDEVHALTFDYGQLHNIEVECAKKIAKMSGVTSHEILEVGNILQSTSPLVNKATPVGQYESVADLPGGTEPTFVPARNILFLTLAVNRACHLGIKDLITGVCEEDYGGYPDCRQKFIDSIQTTFNQGIYGEDEGIVIHTPLMSLSKKDSVLLAQEVGALEALKYSHTCYRGEFPPCGKCHSCHLRQKGFDEAGIPDPLKDRSYIKG